MLRLSPLHEVRDQLAQSLRVVVHASESNVASFAQKITRTVRGVIMIGVKNPLWISTTRGAFSMLRCVLRGVILGCESSMSFARSSAVLGSAYSTELHALIVRTFTARDAQSSCKAIRSNLPSHIDARSARLPPRVSFASTFAAATLTVGIALRLCLSATIEAQLPIVGSSVTASAETKLRVAVAIPSIVACPADGSVRGGLVPFAIDTDWHGGFQPNHELVEWQPPKGRVITARLDEEA